MKKGNHWSIVQKPVDRIRHADAKKFSKVEDEKRKKEAKASASKKQAN